MSNSWDEMRKAKEDSYFDKKNKEALERLTKKQETQRLSPVSGKPMEQVVINGVVVDKCKESGGVWLDAGELEQLMATQEEKHPMTDFIKQILGIKN